MKLPYSRAFVTGASGFIGTHLVKKLQELGVSVFKPSQVDVDISNNSAVQQIVKSIKPEVIFNLAAYGTFRNERDLERMMGVNVLGTLNLLEAAIENDCCSFVQAGSIKEFSPTRLSITEEFSHLPWDEYAISKSAATDFCRLVTTRSHLTTSVLRLSPVYGPDDSPVRFVPVAIRAAISGSPFTITVGSQLRNFIYIDDVIEAFLSASIRSVEKYDDFNIGSSQAYSFEDILLSIEKATGKKIIRIEDTNIEVNDDSWVVDITKAQNFLSLSIPVSLEEGIRRTVEWYSK